MILPVYIYGQPVLRKEAEDITPDYPNLKQLIENMFETMDRADGCGLAAQYVLRFRWNMGRFSLCNSDILFCMGYNYEKPIIKATFLNRDQ